MHQLVKLNMTRSLSLIFTLLVFGSPVNAQTTEGSSFNQALKLVSLQNKKQLEKLERAVIEDQIALVSRTDIVLKAKDDLLPRNYCYLTTTKDAAAMVREW